MLKFADNAVEVGLGAANERQDHPMGFLSFLFGTKKWNADPVQQELAKLIIDVTEGRRRASELLSFVHRQGWSRTEQRTQPRW